MNSRFVPRPGGVAAQALALVLVLALVGGAYAGRKPDRTRPSVAIAAPSAAATVSGRVSVTGTAGDNAGLKRVELSVDTGPFVPAGGTTSWSGSVDTALYDDGTHTVTARATDLAGNASSTTVSLTFSNAPPPPPPPPPPPADTTAPTLAVSAPDAGATVSGAVSFAGSAADNVGVVSVEVRVDDGPFTPAAGTSSWTASVSSTPYADGAHTFTARATDAAGNVATTSVDVTFSNAPPPPPPPPPPTGGSTMTTPEGARIEVAADVTGWTAQQVYDLLKPNARDLDRIGPLLTVKVQTQYPSSTSTGVAESGGVYSNFSATIYLKATATTTFTTRPDSVVAHEYGHVWTSYHLYFPQHGDWSAYLSARGLLGDARVDSTYNWSKSEMAADDYRLLFGTATAVAQSGYINTAAPDPRTVAGLRDFFLAGWATP